MRKRSILRIVFGAIFGRCSDDIVSNRNRVETYERNRVNRPRRKEFREVESKDGKR